MRATKRVIFVIVAIALCICPMTVATAGRTVKVGFFPLNGFFEYDDNSNLSGYGVEYTKAIAKQAGWDYEFVYADSWVDALDMFSRGEIDILAPSEKTAERESKYSFCPFPIGTEYGSLLTLSTNNNLVYEDFSSFDSLNVGCVKSLVFMDSFYEYENNHNFSVNLTYYKDTAALVAALNAGEVAAIVANLMVKNETMKPLAKFGAAPFYYMVHNEDSELLEELNSAVKDFSSQHPTYQNELSKKYFPGFVEDPFTKSELEYIEICDTINVGCSSDFAPFAYENNGKIAGIDKEMLDLISQYSGLKFNLVALPQDNVTYDYLRDNRIMLVMDVEQNNVNGNSYGLSLSSPYLESAKIFVGIQGETYDFDATLRVAVSSASASLLEVMADEYPDFEVVKCKSVQDSIDAVYDGTADILLQNRYVIEPYMADPRNASLAVLPHDSIRVKYCISTITNQIGGEYVDVRMTSVINKAISLISDEEREKIISDEVVKNSYEFGVSDFLYQYRFQLAEFAVIFVVAIIGAVIFLRVRKKISLEIAESEKKLRSITNNINGGVVVLKANIGMEITYANDGFMKLIGCTDYDKSYTAFVHADDLVLLNSLIIQTSNLGEKISVNMRIRKSDGKYIMVLFNGTLNERADGEREFYCVIMDVSEHMKLIEKLNIEKQRSDLLIEKSGEIIFEINMRNNTITVSSKLYDSFGWTFPDTFNGEKEGFLDMWRIDRDDYKTLDESAVKLYEQEKDVSCTVRMEKNSGENIWCRVDQFPIFNEKGKIVEIVGVIRDVDKEYKEKLILEKQANADTLTGLLKKESFALSARNYLEHNANTSTALLFIDLDHFKNVNDTLGHLTGDTAIIDAAKKLQVIFSNFDIISRFGGDEFCVLVKNIPIDTLKDKLAWTVEKLKQTYGTGENTVTVTCSIGVAYSGRLGTQYDHLIECADKALYRAKELGRNRYEFL